MRPLLLSLSALLVISFTACGGKKNPKNNKNNDSTLVDSTANKPAPKVDPELDDPQVIRRFAYQSIL